MKNILLVPGHGDGDPGAINKIFNLRESDLTRDFCNALLHSASYDRKQVNFLVHNPEKNLYKEIKKHASLDFSGYNLIVEFHFNSGNQGSGTEILYFNDDKIKYICKDILYDTTRSLLIKNRGFKFRSDLQNPKFFAAKRIPYFLYEICFIDNFQNICNYDAHKWRLVDAVANRLSYYSGV